MWLSGIGKDEQGIEQLEPLFSLQNGCVFAKQSLQTFMAAVY